jgi:predicted ATP-binding protein involved in virulence
MHLKKIKLTNFRCFRDLELSFDRRLTVFTGSNGFGKTTILDAIKFALNYYVRRFPGVKQMIPSSDNITTFYLAGRGDEEFQERYFQIDTTAEFDDGLDVEWSVFIPNRRLPVSERKELAKLRPGGKRISEIIDNYVHDRFEGGKGILPVVAFFDTQRAVVKQKIQRRRGFRKVLEYTAGYDGCLHEGLDFKGVLEWLEIFEKREYDECRQLHDISHRCLENKTIQYALDRLVPGLRNLRTKTNPYRMIVDAEIDGQIVPCKVDEYLSDGYRCMLMLILNLISRIIKLNPNAYTEPEQVLACPGVVLIDEVDLHLHPAWQQRVLPDLMNVFSQIQFIVTTHSPQVVSSVPTECVRKIKKSNCGEENDVIVAQDVQDGKCEQKVIGPTINTQGAKAGQILSSFFDTSERAPNTDLTRDIPMYRDMLANGSWNSEEGEALWEKLSAAMQTDPELASLRVERMFKAYDREKGHEANPQA